MTLRDDLVARHHMLRNQNTLMLGKIATLKVGLEASQHEFCMLKAKADMMTKKTAVVRGYISTKEDENDTLQAVLRSLNSEIAAAKATHAKMAKQLEEVKRGSACCRERSLALAKKLDEADALEREASEREATSKIREARSRKLHAEAEAADARATEATERARGAEAAATEAGEKAREAEARAIESAERAREAEARAIESAERATEATERARGAEEKAREAEAAAAHVMARAWWMQQTIYQNVYGWAAALGGLCESMVPGPPDRPRTMVFIPNGEGHRHFAA